MLVSSSNYRDLIEGEVVIQVVPEAWGEETKPEDYDEIEYVPPTAIWFFITSRYTHSQRMTW